MCVDVVDVVKEGFEFFDLSRDDVVDVVKDGLEKMDLINMFFKFVVEVVKKVLEDYNFGSFFYLVNNERVLVFRSVSMGFYIFMLLFLFFFGFEILMNVFFGLLVLKFDIEEVVKFVFDLFDFLFDVLDVVKIIFDGFDFVVVVGFSLGVIKFDLFKVDVVDVVKEGIWVLDFFIEIVVDVIDIVKKEFE